jgi:hypothetical protein
VRVADAVLVDNDVVLKLCCYGLGGVLAGGFGAERPVMLAVGRFTLRDRVRRSQSINDRDRVARDLEQAFELTTQATPTTDEIEFAARLEELALSRSLELDTGESQLLAMLLMRPHPLLVTGDKRAIIAVGGLELAEARHRLACLEQLLVTLLGSVPLNIMRQGVCSEPKTDKAATACFSCTAPSVDGDDVLVGLESYVEHLRRLSGETLVPGGTLPG